ncbi:MAG: type II toxin-antitoxin system Phd/YefM family antitoxin [Anaerolineae bacterium]
MDISINLAEDIYPLSELQAKTEQLIEKARLTRRPLIITEEGRSIVAVIDIGEFQALREQAALALDMLDIAEAEQGSFTPHAEVKTRYSWLFEEPTDAATSR